MTDIRGNLLELGDTVNVPEPNDSDLHNNTFVGSVHDILEARGTAIIVDGDGDFFEIETDRLKKMN